MPKCILICININDRIFNAYFLVKVKDEQNSLFNSKFKISKNLVCKNTKVTHASRNKNRDSINIQLCNK